MASRAAEAAEKTRQANAEVQGTEERFRQIRLATDKLPKEQIEGMVEMFESEIAKLRADAQAASELEQRLRTEEADVQSVLAAEQGRWNDFNARLDELERALPK